MPYPPSKAVRIVGALRALCALILPPKRTAEIHLALADQGPDVLFKGVTVDGLDAVEALTAFSERHALARLAIDEGFGPEARFELNQSPLRWAESRLRFRLVLSCRQLRTARRL